MFVKFLDIDKYKYLMCTGYTVNILSSDNITPDWTAELRKC